MTLHRAGRFVNMSFIRKIKRGNRIYLAEVENYRDGVKVHQKLIRYLGPDPTCLQNDIPFKINDLKLTRFARTLSNHHQEKMLYYVGIVAMRWNYGKFGILPEGSYMILNS